MMDDPTKSNRMIEKGREEASSAWTNGENVDDGTPWYAVRLFTPRQQDVAECFRQKGLVYFIPMEYVDILDKEGHIRHVLRPVVRNLLFVKKTKEEHQMRAIFSAIPYAISVIRKEQGCPDYNEIPSRQMFEFQLMCNPDIAMRKYVSEQEAHLKSGTPVIVKHGPLKGLSGVLVRSSKKYYLLKEVPGMGVMLKVSRWCCQPLSEDDP